MSVLRVFRGGQRRLDRVPSARRVATTTASAALLLAGCGGARVADLAPPSAAGPETYWALTLRDRAINLSVAAPTNTLQLTVVPRNTTGAPLVGVTAAPTYTARDPEGHITVSPAGLLTAHQAGTRLAVVATWQYGTVSHSDTAYVTVTETAPASPLATFSMQPAPGDSAKWSRSLLGDKSVVPTMTDAAGHPVTGLAVAYTSSVRHVADVDAQGQLFVRDPGQTVIHASTYAYGVRKTDSVTYTIGLPTFVFVGLEPRAPAMGGGTYVVPGTVTIGVGGVVLWSNDTSEPVTVAFTNPAAAEAAFEGSEGGDIAPLAANDFAFRRFSTPGEYAYHDAQGHPLGTIIVRRD